MSVLEDRSRARGAVLERRGPGDYLVRGDRYAGALLALEAVAQDVREWTEAIDDA